MFKIPERYYYYDKTYHFDSQFKITLKEFLDYKIAELHADCTIKE